jgi:hypothetical protein
MRQSTRWSKTSSKLCPSLYQGIDLYALAASAAGMGMLAFAQPAEARIVYTPTHRTLTNGTLPIPIVGTHDFTLSDKFYIITGSWSSQILDIKIGENAAVVGHNGSATALPAGKTIGPADQFQAGKALMAGAFRETQISASTVFGPFANTTGRFLGLKFTINGKTRYGWARFGRVTASAASGPTVTAVLTGFAFETIPGKPIVAGKTKGSDEEQLNSTSLGAPTPESPTLGLLALGAPALSVWRRKEQD